MHLILLSASSRREPAQRRKRRFQSQHVVVSRPRGIVVPRHSVEVELREVRKAIEELEHVSGRVKTDLEQEEGAHSAEKGLERRACRGLKCTPAHAAQRQRVHASSEFRRPQRAYETCTGVDPSIVFYRTARLLVLPIRKGVLRGDTQLLYTTCNSWCAVQKRGEALRRLERREQHRAEEMQTGGWDP